MTARHRPAVDPDRRRDRRTAAGRRPDASWLLTDRACWRRCYFLLPLFWLVVASTKSNADLFSSFGLWFADDFNLIENVADVFTFQDGVYVRWLLNTVIYAVVSAVGAAFLPPRPATPSPSTSSPAERACSRIILGAIMVPTTALAIPTYLLFARVDLTDTPWAIILPSLVSPFGVFLMRVYAADAVGHA